MNAKDVLLYGHQTILKELTGLAETQATTGFVTNKWTVKDIVGHLAAHEHLNEFQADERKNKQYRELLMEYGSAHDFAMNMIGLLAPDLLKRPGTLPWYGPGYSIEDYIVYANYGHKREHAAQIKLFKLHLQH